MKELSGEERIIRVLEKKETDKVPTFEWYIDKKVIEVLSPGSDFEKFCYHVDIDAICVNCNFDKKMIAGGLMPFNEFLMKLIDDPETLKKYGQYS